MGDCGEARMGSGTREIAMVEVVAGCGGGQISLGSGWCGDLHKSR